MAFTEGLTAGQSTPTFLEGITSGAKSGAEYVKAVEEARYAPQKAAIEQAQREATLEQTQQLNQLRGYELEDAARIEALATQQPSSDAYAQISTTQGKKQQLQEKLSQLEAKRSAVRHDATKATMYQKQYDDVKQEIKDLDTEEKAIQKGHLERVYTPVLAANDQQSWDEARQDYAREQVLAMKETAARNGQPEPTAQELQQAYQDILSKLPAKYDSSAKYFQRTKGMELGKLKDTLDIQEMETKAEKAKLDAQKTRSEIQKIRIETDRVASGKPDAKETMKSWQESNKVASNLRGTISQIDTRIAGLTVKLDTALEDTTKQLITEQIAELEEERAGLKAQLTSTEQEANLLKEMVFAKNPDLKTKMDSGTFSSADEVKAAYKAGKISREKAVTLLKDYGYK